MPTGIIKKRRYQKISLPTKIRVLLTLRAVIVKNKYCSTVIDKRSPHSKNKITESLPLLNKTQLKYWQDYSNIDL